MRNCLSITKYFVACSRLMSRLRSRPHSRPHSRPRPCPRPHLHHQYLSSHRQRIPPPQPPIYLRALCNALITINCRPVGLLESLPQCLRHFETLPMAVLFQEAHLSVANLTRARALVHRHPLVCYLFAGRPKQGSGSLGSLGQIKVVTASVMLVHVYMVAQASLHNIQTQYATVAELAPVALLQAYFMELSKP